MSEPVTTLTDFILAALAWWWAWNLRQRGRTIERSRRLWAFGLIAQGAGAFLGGLCHGFPSLLGPEASMFLWHLTLVLLGGASALFVSGLGIAALPARPASVLFGAMLVKFVAYAVWAWLRKDFALALCDQALSLLLLIGLLIPSRRRPPTPFIAFGLLALILGGLIQHLRLGLHEHFNHNDIYHVFGALTLWCFYRAGRLMKDHE